MLQTKIIEIVLTFSLLAGGYWFFHQQGKKIDELTAKLDATNTAMKDYGSHIARENASRQKFLTDLQEFSKNENANRIAVASGTKQLRVNATCPKAPKMGDGPRVEETRPILTADAGQDYYDARQNIFRNENLLIKCQADLLDALNKINGEGDYKPEPKGFFR